METAKSERVRVVMRLLAARGEISIERVLNLVVLVLCVDLNGVSYDLCHRFSRY